MPNDLHIESNPHDVMPATATKLVVLLYDGAIAALERALGAIEEGDLEGRCQAINMAVDIIANLSLALDTENGGEVAGNLSKLYGFMISRLHRANLLNDPQAAKDVIRLLEPLYTSWRELDRMVAAQALHPADNHHQMAAAG